jgi:hypothetical protein
MLLRLMVGVPAYRGIVQDRLIDSIGGLWVNCVISEAMHGSLKADRYALNQPIGFKWLGRPRGTSCGIATNRNLMLSAAMKAGADWFLMNDADNWADPGPVLNMIGEAHKRATAVVAAPVMRRSGEYNAGIVLEDGAEVVYTPEYGGKVWTAGRLGAACMAIDCRWIRANWPWSASDPWFVFRDIGETEPEGVEGEDFSFCVGVRKRGGRAELDARFEAIHDGAPYKCQSSPRN